MPTPKQAKLLKLLLENLGKAGSTKSLGKMILEAGYSEAMAKNPQMIMESETIKEGLQDFISSLADKRRLAITHITEKKLKNSTAYQLVSVIDILTKNHQLLSGKETEKVGFSLTKLFDESNEKSL